MSSSRVVDATPINLKERIAALQQLTNTSNPPPSLNPPTNNDVSSILQHPNANIKLREKIARFEKKGGVPIPRGSFGLGAPPLPDGHTKRQGELYGNRIPQPVRVVSGPQGAAPLSGHSHPSPAAMKSRGNYQRSFSLSTANTLMASELACGVDKSSASAEGEPVHQVSSLSVQSSTKLEGDEDLSPAVNPLPDIVISQGEGDCITEGAGRSSGEAQISSGVGAEVPSAAENVTTPSAHSSDIDSKPTSLISSDVSVSPPFTSSPPSALSSSPNLDAAPTSLPTPSCVPSTSLRAAGHTGPSVKSILQQQPSNNKSDSVSCNDESKTPAMGIALESPQSLQEESTSFGHTAKKIYSKENLRAETKAKVNEGEADIKGNQIQTLALDLDSGIAQPHNPSKETARGIQPESETPSSPTTPHATQASLPETTHSTPIKSSASLEIYSQSGSSTLLASTIESTTSVSHTQPLQKAAGGERGSVTFLHQDSLQQNPSSYSAVVHNKRRDDVPNSRSVAIQIPQVGRAASGPLGNRSSSSNVSGSTTTAIPNLPTIPTSSGLGDLSDLLQSAFLLEQTLETGVTLTDPNIPAIVAYGDGDVSQEIVTTRSDGVEVRRLSKGEAEENKRTLDKLQAKREEQAKSKLRSSFRNTLTRAAGGGNGGPASGAGLVASLDTGEPATTTSQQELQPQYYSKRFKSPSVPHLLDASPDDGSIRTPENQIGRSNKPASLTSKTSAKSRFPNFRRLTSSSKSSDGHGVGHARGSFSTSSEISSEDSSPAAVTPPDVTTEFGEAVKGRTGFGNSGMSWQGSPQKKGKDAMLRAATFAGKIWSRARTRSGASTLSTPSSLGRPSSEAPPSLPALILPEESENLIKPPVRSTSLSPRSPKFPSSQLPDLSLSPSLGAGGTGLSTPVQFFKHTNSLSPDSPSNAHTTNLRRQSEMSSASPTSPPSIRPLSWMSASSSGSHLNSSLAMLDSDFFDAFPSVPENQPLVLSPQNPSSTRLTSKSSQPLSSTSAMSSLPPLERDAAGVKRSSDDGFLDGAEC